MDNFDITQPRSYRSIIIGIIIFFVVLLILFIIATILFLVFRKPGCVDPPQKVTATSTGTTINGSWSAVDGADGYNVYLGKTADFDPANKQDFVYTATTPNTNITITGTQFSGIHYFKVDAYKNITNTGTSIQTCTSTAVPSPGIELETGKTCTTVVAPPTNVKVTGTANNYTLTWTAPTSTVDGYNIYLGTTTPFTPSTSNYIANVKANTTTYTIPPQKCITTTMPVTCTYYAVVVAVTVSNGLTCYSNPAPSSGIPLLYMYSNPNLGFFNQGPLRNF